ncbi:MAG: TetR/AcrR family transcriptional regulator [Thermoleophilia bacterium]
MGDTDERPAACDPRVARSRSAVLDATGQLLCEEGFPGVTIEAVAARSGVAKTTIYRHWPTRAELLAAAFHHMSCDMPRADTGDVRDDLVALISGLAEQLRTERWAGALPSLAAEALHDPAFAELHSAFVAERRQKVLDVIRRGVERGQLPADTDAGLLGTMVAGPLFFRALVTLEPLDEPGLAERIVDAALNGMRTSRVAG